MPHSLLLFIYDLGYFRSIELPITVSRSAFNRELDYYGIDQGSFAKTMDSLVAPVIEAQKKWSKVIWHFSYCGPVLP